MKRNQYNAYEIPGAEVSAPLLDFGKPETPNAIEMLGQILDAKLPGWRDVVGRAQVKPQGKPRNEFSEFGRAFKEHATDYGWVPEMAKGIPGAAGAAATTGLGAAFGVDKAWDNIGGAMDVAGRLPGAMAQEFGRSWREEGPGATLGGIAGDIAQPGPEMMGPMMAAAGPFPWGKTRFVKPNPEGKSAAELLARQREFKQEPMFPGVYDDPERMIDEVAGEILPEHPRFREAWGVPEKSLAETMPTRDEVRPFLGDAAPTWEGSPLPTHFDYRMTGTANTDRLRRLYQLGNQHPLLHQTTGWYNMEPVFRELERRVGHGEALRQIALMAGLSGPFSQMTSVPFEIARASRARAAINRRWRGDRRMFDQFAEYGGNPVANVGRPLREGQVMRPSKFDLPFLMPEILYSPGSTSTWSEIAKAMERLAENPGSPVFWDQSRKSVPAKTTAYAQQQMPHLGELPGYGAHTLSTGDAHLIRGIGAPDARLNRSVDSITEPEAGLLYPWLDRIAADVGLYGGQTQPLQWITMSRKTGIDTPLYTTKAGVLVDMIDDAARRNDLSFDEAMQLWAEGDLILDVPTHMGGTRVPGVNRRTSRSFPSASPDEEALKKFAGARSRSEARRKAIMRGEKMPEF